MYVCVCVCVCVCFSAFSAVLEPHAGRSLVLPFFLKFFLSSCGIDCVGSVFIIVLQCCQDQQALVFDNYIYVLGLAHYHIYLILT